MEEFERFFDELPASVRSDLSFMMVTLFDEDAINHDLDSDYVAAARWLFAARTRIGRLAKLINAVSTFDVYFAMDSRERFDPEKREPLGSAEHIPPVARYADQIGSIRAAKQRWRELRRTTLSPEAIAMALIPADPPRRRSRGPYSPFLRPDGGHGSTSHDGVSGDP